MNRPFRSRQTSSTPARLALGTRLPFSGAPRASEYPTNATRSGTPKIVLFGLFGCGNSGNDGSLEAMLTFVRQTRPDADIVCICADPDLIGRRYSVRAIPIDWSYTALRRYGGAARAALKIPARILDLVRTARDLRGTDIIVVPGTGILDDFGERPWTMPYSLLKWCLAGRLVGAKIAFVSIGAGPIHHPVSRWLMKTAARLASYRSYRDEISKDYMSSIGLHAPNDPIYPDIAFKLPRPEELDRAETPNAPLTIGVGLMSYSGWYNFAQDGAEIYSTYVKKISAFVVWILDRGHAVRLLKGETSDQRAIDDVLHAVWSARPDLTGGRLMAAPSTSLHDLMREIAATDIVVATRFHNVVCALKLGRPTISLGYARKNDVLLDSFGLQAFHQHVEEFDLDWLIERFQALELRRADYEAAIRATSRRYSELLAEQDEELSRLLPA